MFRYVLKFMTFSSKSDHLVRFYQLQIYVLLIMVLDCQEANMMQQHGLRLIFHRSIRDYLVMKSGCGETLYTPCKNGARHLIKSILFTLNSNISDRTNFPYQSYRPEKDTAENTKYNYYVSKVQIHSEHCIGFLKRALAITLGSLSLHKQ
jgi:hypothetical protein